MPVTMAEANRALRQLPENARLAVEEVASVTAFQVAREAAAEIPVGRGRQGQIHNFKTGLTSAGTHLRELVSWKRTTGGAQVRVDKRGYYWRFLEYGTSKMKAIGMFRRAGDANRAGHAARLLAALERENTKMTKGG